MIVVVGVIIGAIYGGLLARKRKGKPLDILQYTVVYGLIGALIGLFATIIAHRSML
ncbi:hypothetical protein [Litorivita pollutaquae]|uniref:hypothetical protein n=1 Tax=Litorivita pollutaquae TaxID=2200892 RepID=UPI00195531FB|nr:hypothetical protein [Litorivita pollutaquae]